MFCGKCGATIPDDDVFCSVCGAPVSKNVTQASGSQSINQQPVYIQPIVVQAAPPAVEDKNISQNGFSVAALLLGVLSFFTCMVPVFGLVNCSGAIVFSIIGLAKKNSDKIRCIVALLITFLPLLLSIAAFSDFLKKF